MGHRHGAIGIASLIAALLLVGLALPMRAASPSPSASELVPPDELRFFAWLDAPLPSDPGDGTSIRIGAYIADVSGGSGLTGTALQAKLYSDLPDGAASIAPAVEDWPGHVTTTISVPGAVGHLEYVLPGSNCNASGCTPSDLAIPVSGVGPPPNVALPRLAMAFVDFPTQVVPVGLDTTLGFSVQPRIDWPAPGLELPRRLWLQIRVPQGDPLDDVVALIDTPNVGHYSATVRVPVAGDYVVQVAIVQNGSREDQFSTGIRRITAVDIDALPSPAGSPPPGGTGDGRDAVPGWVVPAFVVGGVLAVLLLVLGRRRGAVP